VADDGYKVCLLFSAWTNECYGHVRIRFCRLFTRRGYRLSDGAYVSLIYN